MLVAFDSAKEGGGGKKGGENDNMGKIKSKISE
jgi:hypothetical protein